METATFQAIPVENIKPSSHQARKDFNPAAIQTLADSMKLEGLIQPIVVRKVSSAQPAGSSNDNAVSADCSLNTAAYELIAGERRFRAAKLLGWPTIEAKVVATVSEGEAAAKGLVENLQRDDLNSIEEAEGFQRLTQLDPYWTHEKIAQVAGKGRNYVTQGIGLLSLPDSVKEFARRRALDRSHALELLAISDPEKQQVIADQVVKEGLTIKQTRQLVDGIVGGKKAANRAQRTAGSSDLLAARSALPADLAWKGGKIAINRHFDPAAESVQDYIAWLTPALQAFAETKPVKATPAPNRGPSPVGDAVTADVTVQAVSDLAKNLLGGLF